MVSHQEVLGAPRACSTSPLDLGGPCLVLMEALVGQWVPVSWVLHPLPAGVIPSGMAQVTPCVVVLYGEVPDLVLDHTIEAEVAEEEMNLPRRHRHSEEPEEVALEEAPQMDEGALVGTWLEVADIVPMKALVAAWAVAVDTVPTMALAAAWAADTVPTMALAVAWEVAVAIVPTKAPAGAWAEVVDIALMKALDMGGPMVTGLTMSLVTEAMTIEGRHLMSTVAMMALDMEEGAIEGMMEATAMEETCQTALSVGIS